MTRGMTLILGLLLGAAACVVLLRYVPELGERVIARDAGGDRETAHGVPAEDDEHAASADDDDDEDEDEDEDAGEVVWRDGRRVVVLGAASLALAGIEIAPVAEADPRPAFRVVGEVVDLAAFLAAHETALGAREHAAAHAETVQAIATRLKDLRALSARNQVGAAREIARLEIEHRRAQAEQVALRQTAQSLEAMLRATWGAALVDAASSPGVPGALLSAAGSALVVFSTDSADLPSGLRVGTGRHDEAAVDAHLVGPAPAVAATANTPSWYARVSGPRFRKGMRVDVWFTTPGRQRDGVFVPAGAVAWHAGRQWVFVAHGDEAFERRALDPLWRVGDGFVSATLPAGTMLVVQGAQALLAEEFRGAIPDEDDD